MSEKDDRSAGELLTQLSQETSTLVRQEVQLAQAEMTQKATRVGKNSGFLVVGVIVAYTGLLAIIAGAIAVLGNVIPVWLSALLIGFVITAVGGLLAFKGIRTLRSEQPAPQETVETLQEDRQWLKDQTK